jgi:transcriptional regulator
MADDKPDILPGTLDMLVLKALMGGAQHGYAIARRIQQTSGVVLQVEEGSLYPALHRMERRGALTSEWGASESNRRAKFYRLTAAGRRELRASAAAWLRMSGAVTQVMDARPEGA